MLSSAEPLELGELIGRAWAIMDPLLLLAPNEKEYVDGILGGEVLPNLLFDATSEDAKVISEHPAIQWKVHNVRNYLKRQSG